MIMRCDEESGADHALAGTPLGKMGTELSFSVASFLDRTICPRNLHIQIAITSRMKPSHLALSDQSPASKG